MKAPSTRERLDRTVAPTPQRNDTGADRCAPPRSEKRADPIRPAPPTDADRRASQIAEVDHVTAKASPIKGSVRPMSRPASGVAPAGGGSSEPGANREKQGTEGSLGERRTRPRRVIFGALERRVEAGSGSLWLDVDLSGVGERARRIRTILGLSQAKVARRLEWHREVYGRFERGLHGPSIPSVLAVAAALHVHPNALLDDGWRDLGLEWTGERTVSACRRAIATRRRSA